VVALTEELVRLIPIVCSHSTPSTPPFYLSSTPLSLPRAVLCDLCFLIFAHPMMSSISHSSLQEIVEHNIKASRVCNPTIVDDHLTPMSNIESDSREDHLGQHPDLWRRGWHMCWFGIEDQTCSTCNRIASTCFFVLFHTLVWTLEGY